MLAILDTNHLRELVSQSSTLGGRLRDRIEAEGAEVFVGIVVVEEAMHGWMALLNRLIAGPDQVEVYAHMKMSLEAAVKLGVLPFDQDAAAIFVGLRRTFRRLGTMDLKIAAICLAHDVTLLSRNLADFNGIPGLRVDNWLD